MDQAVPLRPLARLLALAAVAAVLATGLAAGPAAPAHSATGTTADGDFEVRYDPADPGAGATITDYFGPSGALVVPATVAFGGVDYAVTAIGTQAFRDNGLTAVDLPSGLRTIGSSAFLNNSITILEIPDSVTAIGEQAFRNNKIATLTLPASGPVALGIAVFYENELTTVTIPEWMTFIPGATFLANRLTEIVIPDTVTEIGEAAFGDNQIETVTLPDHYVALGPRVFQYNRITAFEIPAWMTYVPVGLLEVNAITALDIPDTVTAIGAYAFRWNEIASLTLPSTPVGLGNEVFAVNQIAELEWPAWLTAVPDRTFAANRLTTLVVPDGVTTIGMFAFNDNDLVSIELPAGVDVGTGAFGANDLGAVVLRGDAPTVQPTSFAPNPSLRFLRRSTATGFAAAPWHDWTVERLGIVALDPNGGTGAPASVDVIDPLPATGPTRPGHVFTGWNSAPDGSGDAHAPGAVLGFAAPDVTLYAQWSRTPFVAVTAPPTLAAVEGAPVALDLTCVTADATEFACAPGEVEIAAPGATVDGVTVTYPFDPGNAGGTTVRTVTIVPAGGGVPATVEVAVTSAATGIRLVPSATAVDQGGSVAFTVEAVDADGSALGDLAGHVVLTSDVATDVVDGLTVTFPTASPHTVTATGPNGLTAAVTVEVRPAAIAEEPEEPEHPEEPTEEPPPGPASMPDTGGEPGATGALALLLAAAGLVALGAQALRGRRVRH